ncbi:MAG: hypothetical protein HC830_05460 [Bacteroidetes bacterium]|nr:hypothetical protein [Bacteroidota bacterium]
MTSLKSEVFAYVFNNIFYYTGKLNYIPSTPIQGFYTDVLKKDMHGYNLFFNINRYPPAVPEIFLPIRNLLISIKLVLVFAMG